MNLKELIRTANLPTLVDAIKDLSDLGNKQALRLNAAIMLNNQVKDPVKVCQDPAVFSKQEYMKTLQKDNEEGKFNNNDPGKSVSITESPRSGK